MVPLVEVLMTLKELSWAFLADLDLVTAGVGGPAGAVADAVALASVLGATCMVVWMVYSSSSL